MSKAKQLLSEAKDSNSVRVECSTVECKFQEAKLESEGTCTRSDIFVGNAICKSFSIRQGSILPEENPFAEDDDEDEDELVMRMGEPQEG